MNNNLFNYILSLGDNPLILGQRLSEWCGHGPILEVDMALTNIALDLLGQTRSYFQYAVEIENKGRTEDDLAFQRNVPDFTNVILVEQPNHDFAYTIVRQFFFDAFHHLFLQKLQFSKDKQLAAIAEKSLKEVAYHLRYSSEWVIRLGDGTEESHQKMQNAIDDLWMFTGELCETTALDEEMAKQGIGVDLNEIKPAYFQKLENILERATLKKPDSDWMQSGGKSGRHSEHLGYILTELQWMERTYPKMKW